MIETRKIETGTGLIFDVSVGGREFGSVGADAARVLRLPLFLG